MVVAEITIIPVGTENSSLSKYVAKALKELEKSGVEYELTSSGTILEGELEEVLETARKMHESVFDDEIKRVVTSLEIDDRRDKSLSISGKKNSVTKRLEETVSK